jgi:hypothetical protein
LTNIVPDSQQLILRQVGKAGHPFVLEAGAYVSEFASSRVSGCQLA